MNIHQKLPGNIRRLRQAIDAFNLPSFGGVSCPQQLLFGEAIEGQEEIGSRYNRIVENKWI